MYLDVNGIPTDSIFPICSVQENEFHIEKVSFITLQKKVEVMNTKWQNRHCRKICPRFLCGDEFSETFNCQ